MQKFAVLGAGAWGTALAFQLARVNPDSTIFLWGFDPEQQKRLQQDHCNVQCFPDHPFLENIYPVIELTEAISNVKGVVIAVPSHGYADLIARISPLCSTALPILSLTKGLDPHSGNFLHTVMNPEQHFSILSGPSFATEVIKQLPTAITIASSQHEHATFWQTYLHSDFFRVYTTDDMIGVQLGGTVKNVLAIATGIADGLGFGANARAGLITRGLAEMMRLNQVLGGKHTTLMGLAGVGDLVLTCTDNQSRNRRFGIALGSGKSIDDALLEVQQVVEGYLAAKLVHNLAEHHQVEMPICNAVYAMLYKNIPIKQATQELLSRTPHKE
ncbi:MAG: NAD(P)H-dependent glycerol-3-phosphate dehydrogenase [Gammaproteobacteria bacterium]